MDWTLFGSWWTRMNFDQCVGRGRLYSPVQVALDFSGNAEGEGSYEELGSSMISCGHKERAVRLDSGTPCDSSCYLGSGRVYLRLCHSSQHTCSCESGCMSKWCWSDHRLEPWAVRKRNVTSTPWVSMVWRALCKWLMYGQIPCMTETVLRGRERFQRSRHSAGTMSTLLQEALRLGVNWPGHILLPVTDCCYSL